MEILENLITFLNNPKTKKEITVKIFKYFEENEHKKSVGCK